MESSKRISKIYRNDSGNFIDINSGLIGVSKGSAKWGDYDNDGDLDIFLTGVTDQTYTTEDYTSNLYRNDSGTFVERIYDIEDGGEGTTAWGDYDNDGDLDLAVIGICDEHWVNTGNGSEQYTDQGLNIYENIVPSLNNLPSIPLNLSSSVNGSDVTLSWGKSTDNETPQNGLSYNLFVGSISQSQDIMPSMSDISTGHRKVAAIGNVGQNTSWDIKDLPSGAYFWSVQAVDNSYAGSEFAPVQSFSFYTEPTGDGTESDPYLIENFENLCWIAQDSSRWGHNFTQTADIDASETGTWVSGKGWSPIGTEITPFTGNYDGHYFIIDSLYINRDTENYIGLFGMTSGAEIKDLGLRNSDITGKGRVGVLVGNNDSSTITGCFTTGSVEGQYYLGGLIGYNSNSSTVSASYSSASVSGMGTIGGLIGLSSTNSNISNCYSFGNVSGTGNIGGFLGFSNTSSISSCYSTGIVNGSDNSGGFLGLKGSGTICSACFWDVETSGQTVSADGTGKTTLEMQTLSTFTDAGWDFTSETTNGTDDYWNINNVDNNGYPFLSWQIFAFDAPGNLSTSVTGNDFILSWDPVTSAISYSIYSSADPSAFFPVDWTLEASGITEPTWIKYDIVENRRFYVVVSVR